MFNWDTKIDSVKTNMFQDKPPVKEPPDWPNKPPVKEPGEPTEHPPPPAEPPVEEPPNAPGKPPVKEPPSKNPVFHQTDGLAGIDAIGEQVTLLAEIL